MLWHLRLAKYQTKGTSVKPKTIGIVGASRQTGVTHLTVWLANVLCSLYGRRVAVLEWNGNGDFERMEKVCTGKAKTVKPFRVLAVDYYKAAGVKEWELCMQQPYDHLLVDYGRADETALYECGRCEKQIMLGSLTEWQQDMYLVQLVEEKVRKRGLAFAVTFGSKETIENVEKKLRITLKQVPLSEDAFNVCYEDGKKLEDLLQ